VKILVVYFVTCFHDAKSCVGHESILRWMVHCQKGLHLHRFWEWEIFWLSHIACQCIPTYRVYRLCGMVYCT